jgi:biotin transport system substrate-specific component
MARSLSRSVELLWAFIGLFLTIFGTMVEASFANPLASWSDRVVPTVSLGVTYQIGAVLLVGCLGGKNAGALSQIAYLALGLTPWFPVFAQGGGMSYLSEPSFGYLLGFVPGAWVCGWLAFRDRSRLELLGVSCLAGLAVVHLVGIGYLLLRPDAVSWSLVSQYSWQPLPGQLAIACAAAVLAYFLRLLLFY